MPKIPFIDALKIINSSDSFKMKTISVFIVLSILNIAVYSQTFYFGAEGVQIPLTPVSGKFTVEFPDGVDTASLTANGISFDQISSTAVNVQPIYQM